MNTNKAVDSDTIFALLQDTPMITQVWRLIDLILLTHASSLPPTTFNQNETRTLVDAIFGSRAIDFIHAFFPFNALSPSTWSDGHRLL